MIQGWVFLGFLALGSVTAYEDWRERKIRNRWISAGLGFCLAVFVYYGFNSVLGFWGVRLGPLGEFYWPPGYYTAVGVHVLLSIVSAVALWRWGVWPAGDAKLFVVSAFFLPLADPRLPGFPRLLFLVMLINIFVPAGIALAAESLLRLTARGVELSGSLLSVDWSKELKALVDRARVRVKDHWPFRYNLLALAINLFCLFTAFLAVERRLLHAAAGPGARLLVFAGLAAVWGRVSSLLKKPALGAAALCALSAGALVGAFGFGVDAAALLRRGLGMLVNFGEFLALLRFALAFLAERQSRAELRPDDVHPGLVLEDQTWRALKTALGSSLGPRYCDGLSAEEAQALKVWLSSRPARQAGASWRFYRALPFAVWIFAGSLLTFRFRATVLHAMLPELRSAWAAAGRTCERAAL